jgi:hypothetical protein
MDAWVTGLCDILFLVPLPHMGAWLRRLNLNDLLFLVRLPHMATWLRHLNDTLFVIGLPRLQIQLGSGPEAAAAYQWLTERHPRYPLFGRKTVGVELIDVRRFEDFAKYLAKVGGKNSTAYYRRRAFTKGYSFVRINKNDYVEEIHAINTSSPMRQGKPMEKEYIKFKAQFPIEKNWLYLGVKNNQGHLVAYLDIDCVGEVAYVEFALGHAAFLKDGIMYLLFAEAVRVLMDEKSVRYFMYDTHFAYRSDGLRLFKKRIGFRPFHVRWRMNS